MSDLPPAGPGNPPPLRPRCPAGIGLFLRGSGRGCPLPGNVGGCCQTRGIPWTRPKHLKEIDNIRRSLLPHEAIGSVGFLKLFRHESAHHLTSFILIVDLVNLQNKQNLEVYCEFRGLLRIF